MKNALLIIAILVTFFSCKKSSSTSTTQTTTAPPSATTSQIQMVIYAPVFPYQYLYTTAIQTNLEDTLATQGVTTTYTVTNGNRLYTALAQDVASNINATTDSFRVTVYINGVRKYYSAGKHSAEAQFHL
ncbi:MAG TPA: hypothetical protein VNX01_00405 [Bacteroidia bacterium]|nr:hypothetical protein [Bacteroidia bacterium]